MRVIVSIDGDLLVPQNPSLGIAGQREEINRVVRVIGDLLLSPHEIVITHGNAPQVGFMLLRAELASHIVHSLPLDVCGADTQGATGYLLQQLIRNWLGDHQVQKEVVSLITQVLVDPIQLSPGKPQRGIGPFFDQEKAQTYRTTRGWNFVLIQGRGYRRAVPALTPKAVPEIQLIRRLLDPATIVICAGGGGIPVMRDEHGQMVGVEAVVNKADTTGLIARELQAEGMIFVTVWDRLKRVTQEESPGDLMVMSLAGLQEILDRAPEIDEDIYHKFVAARLFLENGGKWVHFCPPNALPADLKFTQGILLQKDIMKVEPG
jgi:carbamate kinase